MKSFKDEPQRSNFLKLGVRVVLPSLLLSVVSVLIISAEVWGERPFETESAAAFSGEQLRLDFGIDYTHIDNRQDLLALPSVGLNYSAGRLVELAAYYDFLYRFAVRGATIHGSGDLTLWTKLVFLTEKNSQPGLGLRFGVKLPNANDQNGLGTDQTDFYALAIASKQMGKFENRINVGMAILDDPQRLRTQQDMLTVALASIYKLSSSWQILTDFYTQQGASTRFRFSKISAGVRHLSGKWVFDGAFKKGLRADDKGYRDELSLDWGIVLGISRFIQFGQN